MGDPSGSTEGGDTNNPDSDNDSGWFDGFFDWIKEGFSNIGKWFENLGKGISDWFSKVWTILDTGFKAIGEWFDNLGKSIGNWFSEVFHTLEVGFSAIGEWFQDLGQGIGDWFKSIGESINNFFVGIKDFFTKKDEDERDEVGGMGDDMSGTVNEVDGLVTSKFGAFYSLKDFLVEFWNAIQDSGNTPPTFEITLPEFCGGGTFNALDLSFYNQYRNYVHGIIAGICYFIFVRRIIEKIPYIIHR